IEEDLMSGEVVAADGRSDFVEAIREFDAGDLDARLLETLACKGCIMGAGMTADAPLFSRRRQVARHVRSRLRDRGSEQWEADMAAYAELDLDRTYAESDQRIPLPSKAELEAILARMGKHDPKDELNCGACGYDTCREHAIAVYKGLAESEMCLPYSIDELKRTVKELNDSHHQLAQSHHDLEETQAALMHSEKLASMGQLAAGIAHELNNPLGVVLMYAHLLQEDEAAPPDLRADLQLIAEEADRCKKIVAGLLHFARQNKVVRQPVDLAALVEKALKATTVPDSVAVRVDRAALGDPVAEIDGDQVLQILINFLSNACSAMEETGGTLTVTLSGDAERVRLCVADTGCGIAEEHRGRIFDPFFTTKQIGVGTGLGLAVTYGIVKMHNGDIQVESNADPARGPTGAAFTVTLPRKGGAKPS
ncbi:MAG: ATP-binding protein, partial [Planctomycetota bacterium]